MDGQRQRPGDELFMQTSNVPDTPTVGPLRINKRESQGSTPSPGAQQYNIPTYPKPSTSTPPPAQAYTVPPTNPPSTQLPYPTGNPSSQQYPAELPSNPSSPPNRGASPASSAYSDGGRSTGSAGQTRPPRPRFDGNDPNRPTALAYPYPTLAERRGSGPKPLPESPQADSPDGHGLFQRAPAPINTAQQQQTQPSNGQTSEQEPVSAATEFAHNYYPPPKSRTNSQTQGTPASLRVPGAQGVSRLASSASVSTTRASRGSPPPPETPVADPGAGGGIEARYAAAGIAGPSTLTNLQAQSLAAQQRQNVYAGQSPPQNTAQQSPPRRPWTPTEDGQGPTLTYQGSTVSQLNNGSPSTQPAQPASQPAANGASGPRPPAESALEQDMQHMQISDEPPPAYSSLAAQNQGYPQEKRPSAAGATAGAAAVGPAAGAPVPAAAQDPKTLAAATAAGVATPTATASGHQSHPALAHNATPADPRQTTPGLSQTSPSPAPSGPTPPPLPEGWISHLDPNSGQYYYIHLPTQSTQWEFPKGPTPLNLNETPASPTGTLVNPFASPTVSTFSGKPPITSPGFPPQQSLYGRESVTSMAGLSSPTAAGFAQPPPVSGVDNYRVAPTNGVYFGPYLRYTNMDVDNGVWYGSIMLITDAIHPPTIHIHQSVDLSPNPRQLKANHIHSHQRWQFHRYDVDLKMEDHDAKWTYAITSHLGCTRYEFIVAGRYETSWRFIAHSGNDFAMNVNANERTKLGGVGFMWKDILQKHQEVGFFHAQLGMGNQIYADRLWKENMLLRQWTATSGKDIRKNAQWTTQHEEEISHAYFHFYTSHLDQPLLREAFAQIPHVLTLDDHDIFDGFGSYPEHMQSSNIVKNIGRVAIEMYLLFQHHTTPTILTNVRDDLDLFTITGTGWHFIKYLGPAVVVVAPDCRSERNQTQIMAGPTYQGLFPKIAVLPPHVQHCIWMLPVPLIYPRLEAAESFASTMATGKKVATGTFNALGKVTSSVAGIVGAKGVVGEGFNSVKKAVGKSGLMSNVLSPFGEIDFMDELRDQWTHESKDLERTYLIRTLQGIAQNKSLRMTFFSGATNCCGAGLVHDPANPQNHKTMYQIISSSVVNAPPSQYVLRMLHPSSHQQAPLFLPQNGQKTQKHGQAPTDTKEDMLDIFGQDVNGQGREMKRLMGRRNYAVVVSYDPETVHGAFAQTMTPGKAPEKGPGTISLAIDFMVQADTSAFGAVSTVKYGPIIIPSVDYGR